MTPFAQLEKSAGLNLSSLIGGLGRFGIGDKLTRFGKGFARTPSEFASFVSGKGLSRPAAELGRAGRLGELTSLGLMLSTPAAAGAGIASVLKPVPAKDQRLGPANMSKDQLENIQRAAERDAPLGIQVARDGFGRLHSERMREIAERGMQAGIQAARDRFGIHNLIPR